MCAAAGGAPRFAATFALPFVSSVKLLATPPIVTCSVAPAGEKPAGVAVQEVSIVAKIVAIAADRSTVTLQGPRGRKVDIAVREPRRLDGVKVGDLVELTYRQGVAIEVSAPARK